jgi:predicted RNA-binding Zn-ribbon protein involved in translation (DUF1610 family)
MLRRASRPLARLFGSIDSGPKPCPSCGLLLGDGGDASYHCDVYGAARIERCPECEETLSVRSIVPTDV